MLVRVFVACLTVGLISGCGRTPEDTTKAREPAAQTGYPAPRWPSYFKPPASIDDLMPAARSLVRNKSGFLGVGMGVLQAGETVLIVPTIASDPMVVQAIVKALDERQVKAQVKYTYELLGQTREQAQRVQQQEQKGRRIADAGIYQASSWITGEFPDPGPPKKWLKERRPDLYAELFPGDSGEPAPAAASSSELSGPLNFARELTLVGAVIQT
jgi:hypothetical protein